MLGQQTTPWGSNGKEVNGKFKPVEQVMRENGLDWRVELEDMFLADGTRVPKSKVTRKVINGVPDTILGVVGDRYTPVQNIDAFKLFNSFVETKQASITTVGNFKGGRVIFVQAEVMVDPIEIIAGDPVKSFMTFGHAHDGSLKILYGFTPVRMWCINQLPNLYRSSHSKLLSVKHTKNVMLGLEQIKDIMDIHRQDFVATAEQYKLLATRGVKKADIEKFVTLVFRKDEKDESDKTQLIDSITHHYETGRGLGTAKTHNYWGLFNAVTEYLTWDSGRTVDNRLQSLWFGENQRLAQKALTVATQLVTGRGKA